MRESGRLITNATINALGQISRLAVGVVIPPFVVARIGKADYGLVVLVATILQFVTLVDLGVPEALMRFMAAALAREDEEELSRTFSSGAVLLLGAAVLAVLSLLVVIARPSWFVQLPASTSRSTVRLLVIALGSVSVVSIATAVGRASFYATERFVLLNSLLIGETVLRLGLVLLLVGPVGAGVLGYAVGRAVPVVISATLIFLIGRKLLPEARLAWRYVRRGALRRVASFGGEVLFNRSAVLLYLQADYLILGRGIGPTAVTIFSLAVVWSQIVRSVVAPAVDVAMPAAAASDARGDLSGLQTMLVRITKYSLLLGTPPLIFLGVFHASLVETWMGPGYAETAHVLLFLVLPEVFALGAIAGAKVFVGLGRVRFFTAANAIAGLCNVVLASVLGIVLGLGPLGVAIAYLAVFLVRYALAQPIYVSRSVGLGVLSFYRQSYLPPALLAIGLAPLALAIQEFVHPFGWTRLVVCAAALGAAAAPLAWLLALDDYDRTVIHDLLRSVVKRLARRSGGE